MPLTLPRRYRIRERGVESFIVFNGVKIFYGSLVGILYQGGSGFLIPVSVSAGDQPLAFQGIAVPPTDFIVGDGKKTCPVDTSGAILEDATVNNLPSNGSVGQRVWSSDDGIFNMLPINDRAPIGQCVRFRATNRGDIRLFTPGEFLTQPLQRTDNLNWPSIAPNSDSSLDVTLPGARAGDVVHSSPDAQLEAGLVVKQIHVQAADTVRITLRNVTGVAIDPVALNWRTLLFKVTRID